jgi:hypothetical protein
MRPDVIDVIFERDSDGNNRDFGLELSSTLCDIM